MSEFGKKLGKELLAGDFGNEEMSTGGMVGNVVVGFIPIVGQVADARDTIAAVRDVWRDPTSGIAYAILGVALVGWLPSGDILKTLKFFKNKKKAITGTYKNVKGHHIHQSASFTKKIGEDSRKYNPNHKDAISIGHDDILFTREMHRKADSVQRRINRALHGKKVKMRETENPFEIKTLGEGTLNPTPSIWVEDLKAFHSLLASKPVGYESADAAYELVKKSARQLEEKGMFPKRIPTR